MSPRACRDRKTAFRSGFESSILGFQGSNSGCRTCGAASTLTRRAILQEDFHFVLFLKLFIFPSLFKTVAPVPSELATSLEGPL